MGAVYLVDIGTEVQAEDHNSLVRLLTGQSGTENAVKLDKWDSATIPTLTLQNLNAAGDALRINNPSGSERFRFGRETAGDDGSAIDVFRLMDGARMIMATGDGAQHTAQRFTLYQSDASTNAVPFLLTYENNASPTADPGSAAILGIQRTGDAYFRSLEVDMIAITGSSSWPKLGIELSIEANHLGGGAASPDRTVGIAVNNYGSLWGLATPQIVDCAFLAQGKEAGFVYSFAAKNMAETIVFSVTGETGLVMSQGLIPRADSTYDIGVNTPQAWRTAYVDKYVATTDGDQANPIFTRLGDLNNGVFFPGDDIFAITTNGTEAVRITSTGLLDFRRAATQNIALGGGAAPTVGTIGGSGPATAGQAAWLKLQLGGSNIFIPYWV